MAFEKQVQKPKPFFYSPYPDDIPKKVNLKRRLRTKFRAPKRIKLLAYPKQITNKYEPPQVKQFKRTIEVVKERQPSRRIQQLAIPKVRKLVAAKLEYKNFKNEYFLNRFDELIKRSLFTVYSRLANVEIPITRGKPLKWTDAEWRAHLEWLGSRAKHKWPFNWKMPSSFEKPITKIHPTVLAPQVSQRPWIRKYQEDLAKRTDQAHKRAIPDPFEGKVKSAAMTGPISAYFEQYAEWLKERAARAKQERTERLQEIHPEPREKPKKASEYYGKWPENVLKLCAKPQWIIDQASKEAELKKAEIEAWDRVSDRKKLKLKPPLRTLRLALATEEQKEELEELLKIQKKEQEEIMNVFKPKEVKELPKGSRIFELAEPLERRKTTKFQFDRDEDKPPFKNYF